MDEKYNNRTQIIISQPSADDLRPTLEQLSEQRILSGWEKRSKKIDWNVGEPYIFRG